MRVICSKHADYWRHGENKRAGKVREGQITITDMDWVDFDYACINYQQQGRRLPSSIYTLELLWGGRESQDSQAFLFCLEILLPCAACTTHTSDLSTLESGGRSQHLSSWKDYPNRDSPLDSLVETKNKRVRQFFWYFQGPSKNVSLWFRQLIATLQKTATRALLWIAVEIILEMAFSSHHNCADLDNLYLFCWGSGCRDVSVTWDFYTWMIWN